MKKLFFVAAAVAAVFSFASADAQCKICGQDFKLKYDDPQIHKAYVNGDINMDDVKLGLEKTGYAWRVKECGKTQTWVAGNHKGQDVIVKLKESKKRKVVKAHVGPERMFVKDINPPKSKSHVGKVLQDGERYVKKGIVNENGIDIMTYEKPKKEKKEKKEKKDK